MSNLLAVAISFVYVFAILGVAEALRKIFKLPVEFTRKVVHIGVGMWSFGTAALFTNKWYAILCPAAFIGLNTISYKRGLFLAMESNDKSNLGTVYFPIAFVLIILLAFDVNKPMMVAALMPMTWGDSFAAIIGKRFGKHHYTIGGTTRSIEGSATMFIMSLVSVLIVFVVLEGLRAPGDVLAAVAFATVTAITATCAEAISPKGLDNLFVPAISLATLALLGLAYNA